MKTKYILHIGTHKTGTTWLQDFLSENRETLLQNGLDYPLIGRKKEGSQAHRYFSAYFRGIKKEYPVGFDDVFTKKISSSEKCILSSEDFYFCSKQACSVDLIKEKLGEDTQIMCYLREPTSHILSLYQEVAKNEECASLQDFINKQKLDIQQGENFSYYNYQKNLDIWERQFKNSIITPYNQFRNSAHYAHDFLKNCGIAIPNTVMKYPERANVSVSPEATLLLIKKNILFVKGMLSLAERNEFKRIILQYDQEITSQIKDKIDYELIDFSGFYAAFSNVNKKYMEMFDEPTLKIYFPKISNMGDKEIKDFLYSFQAQSLHLATVKEADMKGHQTTQKKDDESLLLSEEKQLLLKIAKIIEAESIPQLQLSKQSFENYQKLFNFTWEELEKSKLTLVNSNCALEVERQANIKKNEQIEVQGTLIKQLQHQLDEQIQHMKQLHQECAHLKAEKKTLEIKLNERFNEIAKLTQIWASVENEKIIILEQLKNRQKVIIQDKEKYGFLRQITKMFFVFPFFEKKNKKRKLEKEKEIIKRSGVFDVQWYLKQNPDVAEKGVDPIKHYLCYGVKEGRDPNPNFCTNKYLLDNPDVRKAGVNPLIHFMKIDEKKGQIA